MVPCAFLSIKFAYLTWLCNSQSSRLRDELHEHKIQTLMHQINGLNLGSLANNIRQNPTTVGSAQSHEAISITGSNRIVNVKSNHTLLPEASSDQSMILKTVSERGSSASGVIGQPYYPRRIGNNLHIRRTVQQNYNVVETFFGLFRWSSKTSQLSFTPSDGSSYAEQDDQVEDTKTFMLAPPAWLIRLGFTYGLSGRISHSLFSGLTAALEITRPVPDDAEIFQVCKEGDLKCVQKLLGRGQASVRDVDSCGRTPLFVSSVASFLDP